MSRTTHLDGIPVSSTHVKSWWPSRRRVILWSTWLFRSTVRGVVPTEFPSIRTSAHGGLEFKDTGILLAPKRVAHPAEKQAASMVHKGWRMGAHNEGCEGMHRRGAVERPRKLPGLGSRPRQRWRRELEDQPWTMLDMVERMDPAA